MVHENAQGDSTRVPLKERMREQQEQAMKEALRMTEIIERIVDSEEGLLFFRFLYHVCALPSSPVRVDKDGRIDADMTMTMMGRQAVYQEIAQYMSSRSAVKVEQRPWEAQHKGDK